MDHLIFVMHTPDGKTFSITLEGGEHKSAESMLADKEIWGIVGERFQEMRKEYTETTKDEV